MFLPYLLSQHKWPFGGTPDLAPGTYEEWIKEVPLVERKSGQTWREKISDLRGDSYMMFSQLFGIVFPQFFPTIAGIDL